MNKDLMNKDMIVPGQFSLESIFETIQRNPDMLPTQRRKLIKQKYELLLNSFREQTSTALAIEKEKLANQQTLVHREMVVQVEIITLQIRDQFIETFKTLGANVEKKQLEFLIEFGKDMEVLDKQLENSGINEKRKSMIKALVDKAFGRVCDKLTQLTDEIFETKLPKFSK